MSGQLPSFSLEIFNHDQTQLAMLNVTNPSVQLTYDNIIGAIQVIAYNKILQFKLHSLYYSLAFIFVTIPFHLIYFVCITDTVS